MSWKMIYLARRNPALAAEDFPQAWREHAALGSRCTNVRDKVLTVTQCSRILDRPAALAGASADYDGVNLLGLRDRQAADDIWSDEETLRIMRPDEPRVFSTYVRDFTLVARESLLHCGPVSGTCVIGFLRMRTGVNCGDFARAVDASTTAMWRSLPALARASRLVLNKVHGVPPPGYEYAAVLEAWFSSPDEIAEAFDGTTLWQALPAPIGACLDLDRSVCMLTRVTYKRP